MMRTAFASIALTLLLTNAQAQVVVEPAALTLRLAKCEVTCLALAPKGDRILIGTDKGAELWDIQSAKKVQTFVYNEDGSSTVYHAAFNENGEYVVLIGHSGKRVVGDVKNGKMDRVLNTYTWLPDPRAVKAMGFDMKNSTFDRFYQQLQAKHGDITARSGAKGIVEFSDVTGQVVQTLTFPENKDQHHKAPCLFMDGQFVTGTDDGRVLFYTLK
ncbi:MAG: hypothetical protein IPI07_09400 [Flavobacteriales bacterium]|nr:hypothetical protein [Flavobacteriales bacterium]MBK7752545.1 hypothetical protein [Flavobacteriales bacterium]MBK9538199.1 hypothetical protein [Flavobacteriales bacterium]